MNPIIPEMNKLDDLSKFNSSFIGSLFVRNIAAKLNDAHTLYYINI